MLPVDALLQPSSVPPAAEEFQGQPGLLMICPAEVRPIVCQPQLLRGLVSVFRINVLPENLITVRPSMDEHFLNPLKASRQNALNSCFLLKLYHYHNTLWGNCMCLSILFHYKLNMYIYSMCIPFLPHRHTRACF